MNHNNVPGQGQGSKETPPVSNTPPQSTYQPRSLNTQYNPQQQTTNQYVSNMDLSFKQRNKAMYHSTIVPSQTNQTVNLSLMGRTVNEQNVYESKNEGSRGIDSGFGKQTTVNYSRNLPSYSRDQKGALIPDQQKNPNLNNTSTQGQKVVEKSVTQGNNSEETPEQKRKREIAEIKAKLDEISKKMGNKKMETNPKDDIHKQELNRPARNHGIAQSLIFQSKYSNDNPSQNSAPTGGSMLDQLYAQKKSTQPSQGFNNNPSTSNASFELKQNNQQKQEQQGFFKKFAAGPTGTTGVKNVNNTGQIGTTGTSVAATVAEKKEEKKQAFKAEQKKAENNKAQYIPGQYKANLNINTQNSSGGSSSGSSSSWQKQQQPISNKYTNNTSTENKYSANSANQYQNYKPTATTSNSGTTNAWKTADNIQKTNETIQKNTSPTISSTNQVSTNNYSNITNTNNTNTYTGTTTTNYSFAKKQNPYEVKPAEQTSTPQVAFKKKKESITSSTTLIEATKPVVTSATGKGAFHPSKQPEEEMIFKKTFESDEQEEITRENSASLLQPPKQFKKEDFHIGKKMGKGQFGEVLLVQHKETGFLCGMKIMEKKQIREEDYVGQIARELSIQFYLSHRNIAPLYGYFSDEKHVYLLVEFCTDGQLLQKLRGERRMQESDVAVIMRQVCEGVDYIHKEQIIHRDIKPENILFNHGVVKISDFGWAVYRGFGMRKTASGSPLYYPPEIVKGEEYDDKIDVWNIGMMTYECILGKIPFRIYSEMDLNRIVSDEITFPEWVDVTDTAKDFILKTMRKKGQERMEIRQMLRHPFLSKANEKQLDASILKDFQRVLS